MCHNLGAKTRAARHCTIPRNAQQHARVCYGRRAWARNKPARMLGQPVVCVTLAVPCLIRYGRGPLQTAEIARCDWICGGPARHCPGAVAAFKVR